MAFLETFNWQEYLTDIGFFSITTVAITYLLKKFIDRNYQTSLKDYEAELNKKQKEFEHKLLLVSNTQFRLYEKRIDIIAMLYSLLDDVDVAMQELTSALKMRTGILENDKEIDSSEMAKASNAYNKFLEYFSKNKIFFTDSINSKIEEINKVYKSAYLDYTFNFRNPVTDIPHTTKKMSASIKIKNEIPPIKIEIESEIRKVFDTKASIDVGKE